MADEILPRPTPYGDWPNDHSTTELDRLEKAYLGGCLLVPDWLDFGAALNGEDFSTPARGLIFETMRCFPRRRFDAPLLGVRLEQTGKTAPVFTWGWIVGDLLDNAAAFEDLMPQYVRTIKEASALRRAALEDV